MKKMLSISIGVALSALCNIANADDKKGYEIAQKVDQLNNGFKADTAALELVLYDAHGEKIVRKFESKSVEVEGDGDHSINTFTWPADVDGTRLLTWAHKSGDDDQWMYLPVVKRVKRISSSNKTGSFMGSEFSFEDVGGEQLEEFTYKFIEEATLDGRKTWVVERYPNSVRSGYSKQVVWFDQEYFNPIKIEYYDKKSELLKVSTYDGYKKYENWWRPTQITMKNVKTQKYSVVRWISYNLNADHKLELFSPDNLQYQ